MALPDITATDWYESLVRAALPQLPVTLLNAVVSTARLAEDLYPHRFSRQQERLFWQEAGGGDGRGGGKRDDGGRGSAPFLVRRISLSIALMNLTTGWLGHFPSCHGCGGLAAQHLFGARSGSSMVLMGCSKMLLAVLLGPTLLVGLEAFPNSVLGVLLALSGVELAVACRDMTEKRDAAVMLIGAGLVLRKGTGPAFLISTLAAAVLR